MRISLITALGLMLAAGCSAPAVEVNEVFNHSLCKTLRKGINLVEFGDLATIRSSQLLSSSDPDNASAAAPLGDIILVAVSNGSQPTPGYGFELNTVSGDIAEVRLNYRWLTPAADAVMVQMVTSPCSVVQIQSTTPPAAVSAWLDGKLLGRLSLTE